MSWAGWRFRLILTRTLHSSSNQGHQGADCRFGGRSPRGCGRSMQRQPNRPPELSPRWVNRRHLRRPEVGGSDCHFLSAVARTATSFPGKSAADLLLAIRDGTTQAVGAVYGPFSVTNTCAIVWSEALLGTRSNRPRTSRTVAAWIRIRSRFKGLCDNSQRALRTVAGALSAFSDFSRRQVLPAPAEIRR